MIAIGLPDFDEDAGWNWLIQPGHGEHEIVSMKRSGGEVRFVLRPSPGESASDYGVGHQDAFVKRPTRTGSRRPCRLNAAARAAFRALTEPTDRASQL